MGIASARWTARRRSRIAWRLGRSSAETGSSQSKQPGPGRQRPGQADPLPLAAGERRRDSIHQPLHAAERRDLGQPGLGQVTLPTLEPESDVRGNAQVREQAIVLEDHADPAPAQRLIDPFRGVEEGFAFEADMTRGRRGQSRDQAEARSSCRPPTARTRRRSRDRAAEEPRATVRDEPGGSREHPGPRRRSAHRTIPRAGRLRWTTTSATIATSEIKSVSRPARTESLIWTAS